ncbi:MAG TPA: YhjD/YihY/BrkB family envelope integrity protein, partial [Solirubrobacterales bacterium]|nr:YhjD/YihY/BrkB family envelope integrity protein [Solirubrobacterales bacterium]
MAEDRETGGEERIDTGGEVRRDYRPEGAAPNPGLGATLKRTLTEFQEDNLSDWAAALTYYSALSMFPALIVLVAILGLFGTDETTSTLLDIV